jgi:DNA primase
MIVDVIGLLSELGIRGERRGGSEVWAPCPYPGHEDEEPSWSIVDNPASDRHGLNKCFGCDAGGGALDLVMEVIGLSGYGAAARWVREHGLDEEGPPPLQVRLVTRGGVRPPLELPPGTWGGDLQTWATPARRYLEERGVPPEQVLRWGLRYCVDGDLAGRILVPTYDAAGALLSWTARSYIGDDLRYRSVPGGGLPGAVFGELFWPEPMLRPASRVVLTEGAFNALACERAGAQYLAAFGGASQIAGTEIDRWCALKIASFGEIVLVTDPDATGNRTAELVAGSLHRSPARCKVSRAELPPGVDAAELWKRDPGELRRRLWV